MSSQVRPNKEFQNYTLPPKRESVRNALSPAKMPRRPPFRNSECLQKRRSRNEVRALKREPSHSPTELFRRFSKSNLYYRKTYLDFGSWILDFGTGFISNFSLAENALKNSRCLGLSKSKLQNLNSKIVRPPKGDCPCCNAAKNRCFRSIRNDNSWRRRRAFRRARPMNVRRLTE